MLLLLYRSLVVDCKSRSNKANEARRTPTQTGTSVCTRFICRSWMHRVAHWYNTVRSIVYTEVGDTIESVHDTDITNNRQLNGRSSCPFEYEVDIDYTRIPVSVVAQYAAEGVRCAVCRARGYRCERLKKSRNFLRYFCLDEIGHIYRVTSESVQMRCTFAEMIYSMY